VLYKTGPWLGSKGRAVAAVGGAYLGLPDMDPADLVREARAMGVRALEIRHRDVGFLRDLPELEFISFNGDPIDARPFESLPALRGLGFSGTWGGTIDFSRLPNLEWFSVAECPKKGGIDSLLAGHPRLRDLHIGRFPRADLRGLGGLVALEYLEIFQSRSLRSLEGAEEIGAHLRSLELEGCPALESLAGIERLPHLAHLTIDACRQITDIGPIAGLRDLRFLDLLGLARVDSLAPLAGLPSLELLFVPQRVTDGATELPALPGLKAIWGPARRRLVIPPGIAEYGYLPEDDPFVIEMGRLRRG
jgi:hypothetical protein